MSAAVAPTALRPPKRQQCAACTTTVWKRLRQPQLPVDAKPGSEARDELSPGPALPPGLDRPPCEACGHTNQLMMGLEPWPNPLAVGTAATAFHRHTGRGGGNPAQAHGQDQGQARGGKQGGGIRTRGLCRRGAMRLQARDRGAGHGQSLHAAPPPRPVNPARQSSPKPGSTRPPGAADMLADIDTTGPAPASQQSAACCSGAPLTKLTVGLIVTYKEVNRVYYAKKAAAPPAPRSEADHLDVVVGASWMGRYDIIGTLGQGTFGRVAEATDRQAAGCAVAIKAIRLGSGFKRQARVEVMLLRHLMASQPGVFGERNRHALGLLDTFELDGHTCLVFEKLGPSLYDLVRGTGFTGVSINLTRQLGAQLASGLRFIHAAGVVHCDVKPENVVLATQTTAR